MSLLSAVGGFIEASGGTTVTTFTDSNGDEYQIHAFESVGSDTFIVDSAPYNATVDVLVVGGGGAGAGTTDSPLSGGGGGAGDVVFVENESIDSGSYDVTVGDGVSFPGPNDELDRRLAGSNYDVFGRGDPSSISISNVPKAIGGGNGAPDDGDGADGGSGGAASDNDTAVPGDAIGNGFGNSGGDCTESSDAGGGGGGAGSAGNSTSGSDGGNGGSGKDFSNEFGTQFGENGYFGGGGGGGSHDSGNAGNGGIGGGGNGNFGSGDAQNGQDGTGGGGGGSGNIGGDGGSGIVLIRYKI